MKKYIITSLLSMVCLISYSYADEPTFQDFNLIKPPVMKTKPPPPVVFDSKDEEDLKIFLKNNPKKVTMPAAPYAIPTPAPASDGGPAWQYDQKTGYYFRYIPLSPKSPYAPKVYTPMPQQYQPPQPQYNKNYSMPQPYSMPMYQGGPKMYGAPMGGGSC